MYLLNNFLSSLKIIIIKAEVRLTGTASGKAQMGKVWSAMFPLGIPFASPVSLGL